MKKLLIALAVALIVPTAGLGARSKTITIAPNPATVGQAVTVSGCGYSISDDVFVYFAWTVGAAKKPNAYDDLYIPTDSSGCFSFAWTVPSVPTTVGVVIYSPNHQDLYAHASGTNFQVQS